MAQSESSSVIEQLRASYFKSLASKMAEFSAALAARDFKTIVRLGHQMKGSGRSYGLPEISDLGEQIEEAGENRRTVILESLLTEFATFMNQTLDRQSESERQ